MKTIALFEGGITERRQQAVREDGIVFSRAQYRDPRYGYKWSKWKATGARMGDNAAAATATIQSGFAELVRRDGGEKHVRLP